MTDVQRQDRKLFLRELVRPRRLAWLAVLGVGTLLTHNLVGEWPWLMTPPPVAVGLGVAFVGTYLWKAYRDARENRFFDRRYRLLWENCERRLKLFEDVLAKLNKDQIPDLQEMPRTIRRVGRSLYVALRRADMVANEVGKTERGLPLSPPVATTPTVDRQANELFKIADRNVAEYRQHLNAVMSGVQRTEAQAAVFATTVDAVRMKMIGYRMVGRSPDLSSLDFLHDLQEAKLQLSAIDRALEELELGPYPKMVAVLPEQTVQPNPTAEPPPVVGNWGTDLDADDEDLRQGS